jgi:hypothetical protein
MENFVETLENIVHFSNSFVYIHHDVTTKFLYSSLDSFFVTFITLAMF